MHIYIQYVKPDALIIGSSMLLDANSSILI
jgi:hypothetical protein